MCEHFKQVMEVEVLVGWTALRAGANLRVSAGLGSAGDREGCGRAEVRVEVRWGRAGSLEEVELGSELEEELWQPLLPL